MVLTNQMPEDSQFMIGVTEDWPYAKQLQAGILNELRIMRSENVVIAGGEHREPQLIKTPGQELAEKFDEEHKRKIRAGIMAQLHQGA